MRLLMTKNVRTKALLGVMQQPIPQFWARLVTGESGDICIVGHDYNFNNSELAHHFVLYEKLFDNTVCYLAKFETIQTISSVESLLPNAMGRQAFV